MANNRIYIVCTKCAGTEGDRPRFNEHASCSAGPAETLWTDQCFLLRYDDIGEPVKEVAEK